MTTKSAVNKTYGNSFPCKTRIGVDTKSRRDNEKVVGCFYWKMRPDRRKYPLFDSDFRMKKIKTARAQTVILCPFRKLRFYPGYYGRFCIIMKSVHQPVNCVIAK